MKLRDLFSLIRFFQIYEDKKRLRIGFFLNNGVFRAVPCMERAVLEARDALESAGHEVCILWRERELSLRQEMPLSQSHTHNLQ